MNITGKITGFGLRNALHRGIEEWAFRKFCHRLNRHSISSQITAVIITVDPNPLFDRCVDSVKSQGLSAAQIEVVRNVMPASRASQEGLDRVKTPFYVSVDADMILKPTCFERLYHTMLSQPDCAESRVNLLDPVLGVIECVHMYRTAPVREIGFHPFSGEIGHDRYMTLTLEKRGLRCQRSPRVEADHHPIYLPHEIFWKFRLAGQKALYYNPRDMYTPFRQIFAKLAEYWDRTHSDLAIYGLAGLLEGIQSERPLEELTYEGRLDHPSFLKLKNFLEMTVPTRAR